MVWEAGRGRASYPSRWSSAAKERAGRIEAPVHHLIDVVVVEAGHAWEAVAAGQSVDDGVLQPAQQRYPCREGGEPGAALLSDGGHDRGGGEIGDPDGGQLVAEGEVAQARLDGGERAH